MNTWWNAINLALIILLYFWLLINNGLNTEAINKVNELEIVIDSFKQTKDTTIIHIYNSIQIPNSLNK